MCPSRCAKEREKNRNLFMKKERNQLVIYEDENDTQRRVSERENERESKKYRKVIYYRH